jgi:hypothetical protein
MANPAAASVDKMSFTKGDAPANPYLQTCVVDIGDNFKLVLESAELRRAF